MARLWTTLILFVLCLCTSPHASANMDSHQYEWLKVPGSEFVNSLKDTIDIIRQVTSVVSQFGNMFGDFRLSNAVSDCLDLLDLSADELDWTLSASEKSNGKDNSTGNISADMRTWLSGALVNQDTCMEGFEGTNSIVKSVVAGSLGQVSSLVREALVMVRPTPDVNSKGGKGSGGRGGGGGGGGGAGGGRGGRGGGRKLISHIDNFPYWLKTKDRKLLQASGVGADVVVAADGTGDFTTIKDAVSAAPQLSTKRFVIYIKKGVYKEYVEISKKKWNIMMIGDGMGVTVVTGNRNFIDGWTTYRSATFDMSDTGRLAYIQKKKKQADASGSTRLSQDAAHQGQRQRPSDRVAEVGAEVTSKGASKSPLSKRPSSGVVLQEPDSRKRPRSEHSGKGKGAEVAPPSRDIIEAARVSRDPKLAKFPPEQLSLELRTSVATAESHILSASSFFNKIQTRCVELEHRCVENRAELEAQREEASKQYKADEKEIERLKAELQKEKDRRTHVANDKKKLEAELRAAEARFKELADRVGLNGEKAVEAFKSSEAGVNWVATEGEVMARFAELEYYFRGQVTARERAKTFLPPSQNNYIEVLEAPPKEFWEVPELPADLKAQDEEVMEFVQRGMDQVGEEADGASSSTPDNAPAADVPK